MPLYGEKWIQAYRYASGDRHASKRLGPHCYGTAEEAFARLAHAEAQPAVISGESGAGETGTCRRILEYLCSVGGRKDGGEGAVDPRRVVESNVLMEAFGNAKNMRNHNSSRFGRYSKRSFDRVDGEYKICSVSVEHYLLERIRVVSQPKGERHLVHVVFHTMFMVMTLQQDGGCEYQGMAYGFVGFLSLPSLFLCS